MVLRLLFILLLTGCSSSLYTGSNKVHITHVLTVTSEGDTLKIPISQIRPQVIYNVVGYDYYRPYPGRYNNWADPYYHPIYWSNGSGKSINNKSNKSINQNNPGGSSQGGSSRGGGTPPNPAVKNPRGNN